MRPHIYGLLRNHLDDAVDALKAELSDVTISMLVGELRRLMPELPSLPGQE